MKIELRKVHHSPSLSEETNAFTADVYVDGKKAGSAENHGHGGPTSVFPRDLEEKLNAHAATLPEAKAQLGTDEFTYRQTAETIIDDLLAEYLNEKEAMRLGKKFRTERSVRLFWLTPAGEILQSRKITPDGLARLLSVSAEVETLKARNPNDRLLNLEPDGERLFVEAVMRPAVHAVKVGGGRVALVGGR